MDGVIIVAVVFAGTVLALAVIGGTILMAIKLIKGGVSRKDQTNLAKEAKMVQEIFSCSRTVRYHSKSSHRSLSD